MGVDERPPLPSPLSQGVDPALRPAIQAHSVRTLDPTTVTTKNVAKNRIHIL